MSFVLEKRTFSCLWTRDMLHLFSLKGRGTEPFTFLKLLVKVHLKAKIKVEK